MSAPTTFPISSIDASQNELRGKKDIFYGWEQKVFLGIPILVGIGIFLDFAFGISGPWAQRSILYFVVSGLLFGGSHVGFTFAFMAKLPEFRNWLDYKYGTDHSQFWVFFCTLFLGIFGFFLIGQSHLTFHLGLDPKLMYFLTFITFDFLIAMHAIIQSMGLSLVYNHKIREEFKEDAATLRKINSRENWERKGLWTLVALELLLHSYIFYTLAFVQPMSMKVLWLGTIGNIILCGGIYLIIWTMPGVEKTHKRFFGLRFLMKPWTYFSYIAVLGQFLMHGTEYLFVTKKIVRNSSASGKSRKILIGALVVSLLCLMVFGAHERKSIAGYFFGPYALGPSVEIPWFIGVVGALNWTLVIVHIVLDRMFYRMRDPAVRSTFGKLLTENR